MFTIGKDDNSPSGSDTENSEEDGSEDEVDSIDECDTPRENHAQISHVETESVKAIATQTNNEADDPQTIVDTSPGDGLSVVAVCCV